VSRRCGVGRTRFYASAMLLYGLHDGDLRASVHGVPAT
jgi:hypothetical protein